MPTETLISIIDDDVDFREAIARLMKSRGFTVEAFPSALAFLSCPNIRNTSCLIVDAHMPRMTGSCIVGWWSRAMPFQRS